ncbi:MAG: hypothetical protein H7343_07315 [Undibacterium sp.]|nr:hypothetical protein [Opitutaceae bacterium]
MRLRLLSSLFIVLAALVSSATRAMVVQSFGRAAVVATQAARTTDLVLLDAGYDVGLRAGMVCSVNRGGLSVGDILLVELRPSAAVALILSLTPNQAILSGDQIAVKILKS